VTRSTAERPDRSHDNPLDEAHGVGIDRRQRVDRVLELGLEGLAVGIDRQAGAGRLRRDRHVVA
jgi:hypothetical protein